jgi:hypothetical protein
MIFKHNKQSFADGVEYFKLEKTFGEYLDQYIRDVKAELSMKLSFLFKTSH